ALVASRLESAKAQNDVLGRLTLESQLAARDLALAANVDWKDIYEIDLASYQARAEGYERLVQELGQALEQRPEQERNSDLARYVRASADLVDACKRLMRRVRDRKSWSTGERMTLKSGPSSHWMVDGSPGHV